MDISCAPRTIGQENNLKNEDVPRWCQCREHKGLQLNDNVLSIERIEKKTCNASGKEGDKREGQESRARERHR